MVGSKELEIEQETFGNLARRYWITAVGIVLAAEIVILSTENLGDYIDFSSLIGGGIGVTFGRLILAAVMGEPKSRNLAHFFGAIVLGLPLSFFFLIITNDNFIFCSSAVVIGAVFGPFLLKQFSWWILIKWLGIFIGGIIIFAIPIISLFIMLEKIPVLFVGLLGLVIFLSFNVYKKGHKEPEIYFSPLATALIILVTITTTGLPISVILYSSMIDSLATSFLAGGLIGALLSIILVASARKAGQPGYVAAHIIGVGFAIFGIALGTPIAAIIDFSINGFGIACC